jgi:hypothetical protein
LQALWGLVNVMQLIVQLPLLNLDFPLNTVTFYTILQDISSFNFLPTDKLNFLGNSTQMPPNPKNFQYMGYSTQNSLQNIGSMIFYIMGYFLLALLALFLRAIKKLHWVIGWVEERLSHSLFFNTILRLIMESYIDITVSSILNI